MMDNISISLQEGGRSDVSEVRVDGVIDTKTHQFPTKLFIVVDLAGVDYISSAGWGIFISHIKDVRANDGDIKLASMISNVYEIYELLEFDNVLVAYPSADEARDAFGPAGDDDEKKKSKA